MSVEVQLAISDAEVLGCFECVAELRPHLVRGEFVARIREQQAQGYLLAYITDGSGEAVACAGYRINDYLAHGRMMYVDDLVTKASARSSGYGAELMDWLSQQAIDNDCQQFQLDSGVQRFAAHKFYFREGMSIASYHFAKALTAGGQ